MSEEHRKSNKQCTGTVPKIKYRNNSTYSNDQDRSISLSNNLSTSWHPAPETTNFIRNPRRNPQNNYFPMDNAAVEEHHSLPLQNGVQNFTNSSSLTPHGSASVSRRDSASSTLKCDNVTKYPDKKQIEDKLSQIREYLQITSTLMSSMKNTDEQPDGDEEEKNNLTKMINDLRDSERKLVDLLDYSDEQDNKSNSGVTIMELNSESEIVTENGVDSVSENSASSSKRNEIDLNNLDHQELDVLREQQLALLMLQQKAENKLRNARQIQDRMMAQSQYCNELNSSSQKDNKNMSIADFDVAIRDLEERTRRLKEPRQHNFNSNPEKMMNEVESLHSRIITMHNANNEREQLIEVLDNRDAELRSQQAQLQNKLLELQTKKQQIDQLVDQLQTLDEDDDHNDTGVQVRKIVTMKDQLKKLKDMLEIVKTTETVMTSNPSSAEAQAAAFDICTTAENFLQNEIQKPRLQSNSESNVSVRYDNNTSSDTNRQKQTNKNSRESGGRGANKSRTSSININEQAALQAELKAKKKELEDIMGKHKAGTSNLNHDVGTDSKSEFSCTSNSNTVNETFWRQSASQNHDDTSDRFSSDDCDEEDYPRINPDNPLSAQLPSLRYSPSNTANKIRPDNNSEYAFPTERLPSLSRSPDRNLRSSSVATSGYIREQPRSNNEQDKLQKQLHLIKSVCDSMLAQQNNTANASTAANNQQLNANVHQVRNNLTPSSIYSEPGGRFGAASPNPHAMNALNVVNNEAAWMMHGNGGGSQTDMNNYQNWLTTNTLQTQSFMLNTLNQCCQMLWLQQRELASLRSVVTSLQDKIDPAHFNGSQSIPLLDSTVPPTPLDGHRSSTTNQYRPPGNPKTNQVSAACSMPNLNHHNAPPASNVNQFNAPPASNVNQFNALPISNVNQFNAPPISTVNQFNVPPTSNLNQYNTPPTSNVNQYNAPPTSNVGQYNVPPASNQYNATPPSNLELTNFPNQQPLNNVNGRLLEHHHHHHQCLNNALHAGVNLPNNINQQNVPPSPAQMWNGPPALNNQVAPGNRANNYWDNFRSYSRQNLLSTKNNDGFHQHHNPPSNVAAGGGAGDHRTNPFALMSFSKSNSELDSGSTSQENTPQRRRAPFKPPRHVENINVSTIPPPDVLNINQNQPIKSDRPDLPPSNNLESDIIDEDNINLGHHVLLNLNPHDEGVQQGATANVVEDGSFSKDKEPRRRNEWNSEAQEQRPQKNKLFDELRDNVYKEVASLISANEARPHFLIQLFRDLQMIGSDSLRLKILQSIESVITHSLISSQSSTRQSFESQQSRDSDPLSLQESFSLQSTVWSKPMKNFLSGTRNIINLENDELDVQNAFREIIPMLNDNEDDAVTNEFLIALKQMFLESDSFKETVKDTIFQKHFSNVLDEVLEQYCGKKIRDVKLHLIQTVGDLLRGELSFIQLIQETNPENCEPTAQGMAPQPHLPPGHFGAALFDVGGPGGNGAPSENNNMPNGDLAEADQLGRVAVDVGDIDEEEGAVGGVLEVPMEDEMNNVLLSQGNSEEVLNLPTIDFPCNAEGLDQVPTRLPTKIRSRSTTPTKDRSNPDAEPF